MIFKAYNDINKKNYEESKKAEEVFSKKIPIMTYIFMGICLILFLITAFLSGSVIELNPNVLANFGALLNFNEMGRDYTQTYRLITSIFLHAGLLHFILNMYSLYIIGPQLESLFGKVKYYILFIGSGIIGNLFSMLFLQDRYVSVGASGAIFGLLGALLYFGYHYRVYLSGVIKSQIIPLIAINLIIGFIVSNVNNLAHVGGLIGGVFLASSVGVKYKSLKADIINGIVITTIFVGFLIYMVFVR